MTKQANKPKSKYTAEFRADAVRLVIDEKLAVAQVARDLGMPQNTLHSWVKKARAQTHSSEGPLNEDERAELHRLRREMRILREEREILKKAAAFFAKESR